LELVNIDKHRDYKTGKVTVMGISEDIQGKVCLIYDDVINTGGTVVEVAKYLKKNGAAEVHFLVTHGLFAAKGLEKMTDESIDSIVITNSVHHKSLPGKIKVLDSADIFAMNLKKWI
jgi:ribose-phosphate pyrophosphokinase